MNKYKVENIVNKYLDKNPQHAKDLVKIFPNIEDKYGDEITAGEVGLF